MRRKATSYQGRKNAQGRAKNSNKCAGKSAIPPGKHDDFILGVESQTGGGVICSQGSFAGRRGMVRSGTSEAAGQQPNHGGRSTRNRTCTYIGSRKRCGACSQRPQCTSAAFRCLAIHMHEPARQRARELVDTPEFANAQRQRKKVEALFAELQNQIGLRRLRLRRLKFVRESSS